MRCDSHGNVVCVAGSFTTYSTPPPVHAHKHTHNHMAAEERKESGAAHPANTHQSNNSVVKPICWDKAAKETLLRWVEEQRWVTVFKRMKKMLFFKVMWIETMNGFLVFTTESVKAIQFKCIACVCAIKCATQDTLKLNMTIKTLHPKICNKNLFFCTFHIMSMLLTTVIIVGHWPLTMTNRPLDKALKHYNNIDLFSLYLNETQRWNPFLRAISWDSWDHFHAICFCLYCTPACSHSRHCVVSLKNTRMEHKHMANVPWVFARRGSCDVQSRWRGETEVELLVSLFWAPLPLLQMSIWSPSKCWGCRWTTE